MRFLVFAPLVLGAACTQVDRDDRLPTERPARAVVAEPAPPPPSPPRCDGVTLHDDDGLTAKAYFQAGTKRYEAGEFAAAAGCFLAAWELMPRSQLLYNVGQSFRRAGDRPSARRYFERFLAESEPSAPGAAEARAYLAGSAP